MQGRFAWLVLGCVLGAALPGWAAEPRVWVFSDTVGSRHDSIPAGLARVEALGREQGFAVERVQASRFESRALVGVAAVVWMNASGNVLAATAREAFRGFVEQGGGFVGVHAAAAAETDWPWYGELLGGDARFREHPPVQPIELRVRTPGHPSVRHLPRVFSFTDEWYVFTRHPGPGVQRLLELDPRGLEGRTMRPDHPVAWFHQVGAGRAWYTALGHRAETYADPRFTAHLAGGIAWAGRFDTEAPGSGSVGAVVLVIAGALAVVTAWAWGRGGRRNGDRRPPGRGEGTEAGVSGSVGKRVREAE
jgi:type 1 glutamine amidotransferase